MRITDAQIHVWTSESAALAHSVLHHPLGPEAILKAMDAAGVDRALIIPPKSGANDFCLKVVDQHRERLGLIYVISLANSDHVPLVANWGSRPPTVMGVRLTFPPWSKPSWLEDGTADWYWPMAERQAIPTMVWAPGQWHRIAAIAEEHPHLPLAIDHLGLRVDERNMEMDATIKNIIEMADLANVSVKATEVPNNSSEDYPHSDMARYVRDVIVAFGPERVYWGSDMTARDTNYEQCVTMFTDCMPWMNEGAKRRIMGEAISDWVKWK